MRNRPPMLLSLTLSSAVLVAACSSSGHSASPTAFAASANSSCARYSSQEKALGQPSSSDLPQLSTYLKKVASIGQAEINSLKGLNAPTQDKSQLSALFNEMQQQVTKADQLAASLKNGNLGSAQTQLQQLQSGTAPINQQFDQIGLTACGSGS